MSSSHLGSVLGSLIAGCECNACMIGIANSDVFILYTAGLSEQFGRKYGLMISGIVMMAGSIIMSASYHIWY